ncbi:basic proline-rich protein-like [Pseudopipra pipra]|uniref:basic proline-rich protein-like n=1 Tax=Pseudopipra pipra TaxID=415032 RepID=UPI003139644B
MTAQTERAIHPGPGADKAEAAQKPTRLPGSEAADSSRPLPPGAPRRAPLPGAPVPPRARYLGLRSVPGELPAGSSADRHPSPGSCPVGPGWDPWGAVGCPGCRGAQPRAGRRAARCQQWKAPELGGEDGAEPPQDGAEPPRPWQMLIPGSVSGSRQSPRPRRPPLPGDPEQPHPSAWPTRRQRPPGSRGPARATRAALRGRTPALGGSRWLRGPRSWVWAGWGGGLHCGQEQLAPGFLQHPGWQRGGVPEPQGCSTPAFRVGFATPSWRPSLGPPAVPCFTEPPRPSPAPLSPPSSGSEAPAPAEP